MPTIVDKSSVTKICVDDSSAVSNAHPDTIQISDRFHLIKNISDAVKNAIKYKYNNGLAEGSVNKKS